MRCLLLTFRLTLAENPSNTANRVTKLGEFSPIRQLFSLGSFVENHRSRPYFLATSFQCKSYALVLSKMGWAAFWVIISQTHLVTLTAT
jgi:hypothetical protein